MKKDKRIPSKEDLGLSNNNSSKRESEEDSKKKNGKFNKPLIVFRIRTPEIKKITLKMIKFLIESNYVEYIFLENLSDINSKIIFGNNDKDKYFKQFDKKTQDSNLCIIVGGDGTCLWANGLYKESKKERPPFLCFHGGNLGFLAIYIPEEYEKIFKELYENGNYSLIYRREISCSVYEKENNKDNKNTDNDIMSFEGYKKISKYVALNEIYLEKMANMSHLILFVGGKLLTQISSDGVIFATATGSTAYSLSAGGPILHNDVDGIIVTAICPFSLSFRPIVLPQNIKLRVKNDNSYKKSFSSIKMDGCDHGILNDNQYIEISLTDSTIDFIVLPEIIGKDLDDLWIEKISKSLGWNQSFSVNKK